jgi:fucose 4-O-acetylase-like acetyltransferase
MRNCILNFLVNYTKFKAHNRKVVVMASIGKDLSKRINSLRFLLIIFVVIIHNGITEKNFAGRGMHVVIPDYVENVQTFIGIITAVAVPLFFLISSYLLYVKENMFFPVLKKKVRTILAPYILWTLLFVLLYFTMQTLPFTKPFFAADPERLIKNYGLLDWIDIFWGKITYRSEYGHPFVYQFWFLRDLFILNLLYIPIKKVIDKFPFGTFILCAILWIYNVNIYIVSPEALLFFIFGYYIVKYNLSEKHIDMIQKADIVVVYGTTVILEYLFRGNMPILHKINIIIGCILLLKLSRYFIQNIKLYGMLAWLEKYQFIVYAVHATIMPQILKIYARVIPLNGIYILLGYFMMIVLGIFLSILFGMLFKRLFPKMYAIMTGGRI